MGSIIALPLTFILKVLPESVPDAVYKCKWIISLVYIEIFRYLHSKRLDLYDSCGTDDPEKTGLILPEKEFKLESPFPESHLLKAKDEIFFYGVNSKKERLVVSISRRCDQKADARVYLNLESGKTYSLVMTTDVEQAGVDEHVFSCGHLQLHYNSPMRSWRLFYNGYLRETDESGTERNIYVKFALLWIASSDIYDFMEDIDKTILAKWLASVKWNGFLPPLTRLRKGLNAYGQSGVIQGTINIGNAVDDYEIYLFGQRVRDLGSNLSFESMEFHHFLGYTEKNGMLIHLGELYTPSSTKNLSVGYVIRSDSSLRGVTSLSVKLDDQLFPAKGKRIKALFTAEKDPLKYDCNGVLRGHIKQESPGKSIWSDALYPISFELNGKKGHGFYLRRKLLGLSGTKTSCIPVLNFPTVIPRTVTFKDPECHLPAITGGKGSSLGKLTHFNKDLQTFIVPEGIVVTTASYKEILTKDILSKIKMLEEVLYGNIDGNVNESCERVQLAILKSEFPSSVKLSIEKDMKKVWGESSSELFAIRSSATGEDTEQMSAAGQMDTFLGVSGLEEVIIAVKKCWASQFSYVAVTYKRRYGQCLNSPMAVVIQRMVACDTAGVLFTCDPLTGNPTVITITANYGLGESVVSGSEEPDTVILERDINDELRVKNIDVGAKANRIIVKEDGGTCEESVPENQKNVCCISEEMALRLGNLAVKIEKYYNSARDIEWGFHNNNLYIFQSRPVTSGTNETIYEIDHEFDGPLRVENDYYSTSNVGEVLPGAMTPLGQQVILRAFMNAASKAERQTEFQPSVQARYYKYGWCIFYNHSIFNVADIFHNMDGENFDTTTKATLISFFGRIPDNKDMFAAVKERYGGSVRESNWKSSFLFLKNVFFSRRQLEKTLKSYEGHRVPVEKCKSSREMFDLLLRKATDFSNAFMIHMICTQMSSFWNMLILSILSEENGCFDDNVYRDFANLLRTHSDVESADVPSAMQDLGFHVSKSVNPEEFKSKTPKEALHWLENSSSSAGRKFRQFIEKHGHRCLKEFDIHTTTWGSNPIPLVKLLQNLCGNVSTESSTKKTTTLNESELQVKLGIKSKLKLKFLLPISRTAVQDRERSKSLLIKVVESFRKGYNELAKLMVSEGRIPETDIIFFMTIEEIRDLLETRSPKVLARASQRQRRHPTLDSYIFAEIIKGQPRPMNVEEPIIHTDDNFSMKGIPVSQGIAKGYVRKAIRLEEAADLQPGEILLTYSTDIGWTPYFPTLGGVVTELGGLISHGAVVSREYGIPCIAGLHEATRHFQTGDYVLLDGNKGILQKIPPPVVESS